MSSRVGVQDFSGGARGRGRTEQASSSALTDLTSRIALLLHGERPEQEVVRTDFDL